MSWAAKALSRVGKSRAALRRTVTSVVCHARSVSSPTVVAGLVVLAAAGFTAMVDTTSQKAQCDSHPESVSPLDYTVRISNGSSAGSGFLISEDGFIVTNAHVVAYRTKGTVQVTFSDGRKYAGKIHSCDSISDIALVKIEDSETKFPVAKLGESSEVRAGEAIMAVGAPLHLQNTISHGTVSAPLRHEFEIDLPTRYEAYVQTDISTNPGSSGGPLLNQRGEVIAVHCRKHSGGWGLAIPIDRAKEVIAQLREKGKVTRPYYGMDLSDEVRGRAPHSVVAVANVTAGSPVHACGIRKDDCIIAVDGKEVRRIKDVMDALYANGLRTGTVLEFTLLRQYEVDPVHVRLVTAPRYALEQFTPTLQVPAAHIPTLTPGK